MYTKQISISIKNIIIYSRNVQKTAGFYSDALGLKIINQSSQLIELKDSNNFKILLKKVDGEAFTHKGYSPLINFQVEDLEKLVEKIKNYGGILDGDIIKEGDIKIACFRCPDGEMIGLYQGNQEFSDGEEIKEDKGDKTKEEIRNILKKINF